MPSVALAAVRANLFTKSEALIVVLLGACPGGGASNLFTYYLDLNLDLSIVMTNVSAVLAFAFTPLWLLTVPLVLEDVEFKVPHAEIATGLAQLVAPLVFGVIFNHFWPKKSVVAARVIVAISAIFMIVSIVLNIYKYFPQSIITKGKHHLRYCRCNNCSISASCLCLLVPSYWMYSGDHHLQCTDLDNPENVQSESKLDKY